MEYSEILLNIRALLRLYSKTGERIRKRHQLTEAELDVLAFLGNNPSLDTARDITEYRLLPKANVSIAVDALMQKGLLSGRQDDRDRRRVRLCLTPRGEALMPGIRADRKQFEQILFSGFTPEERSEYQRMNARIAQNARAYLEEERYDEGK